MSMRLSPGLLCAVLLACSDPVEKPEAPDMGPLIAAYATPTADFSQEVADEIGGAVRLELAIVAALEGLESLLRDVLEPAADVASDQQADAGAAGFAEEGAGPSGARNEGEGFFRVERICRGWSGAEVVDADADANGTMEFTIGFTERGIDPVVWGELEGCRELVGGSEVYLHGGVSLYLGDALQFQRVGDEPILFQLRARVDVDGEQRVDQEFDFQHCPHGATACPPGRVEIKVDVPSGGHLLLSFDRASSTAGVRARNGLWPCEVDLSAATATCVSDETGEVVTLVDFLPEEQTP